MLVFDCGIPARLRGRPEKTLRKAPASESGRYKSYPKTKTAAISAAVPGVGGWENQNVSFSVI
jgi:hypothetical protein